MSKPDDFAGGVQEAVALDIVQQVGTLVGGNLLTPADAIALLSALVATQSKALNPGQGQLGFLDAFKAFDELDTVYQQWKLAKTAAAVKTATDDMVTAIKALQKLFAKGPIPAGFFTFPPG